MTGTMNRRSFLRGALGAAGGLTAVAAALSPLKDFDTSGMTLEKFLQKHYKEMTGGDGEGRWSGSAQRWKRATRCGPICATSSRWTAWSSLYALNLGRCIGCRKCVHACVAENNQSRSPEIQYIRVLEMPRGSIDNVERGNHHYEHAKVPDPDHYYMPVQCHQCKNPPCVKVCPVEATWQEPDGLTVIDYDWCIGCRYCEAACPYWARRFNFTKPKIPKQEAQPEDVLPLEPAAAEGSDGKVHLLPAAHARGEDAGLPRDLPDRRAQVRQRAGPDSEVAEILRTNRVFVLKQDAGTMPRFFYYFDEQLSGQRGVPAETS
jgi:Fe-S-cluster-containing dehydrogenase component